MLSRDFIIRPLKWLEMIQKSGAHTSGGPNFSYEYCCAQIDTERLDLDLSGWKVAFNGSEPVHYNTIMRFYNKFKPFGFSYNAMTPCYELAEATLFVSAKHEDESFAYAAKQQVSHEKKEYHSIPSDMKMVSSGHIAENILVYVMEPGSMNVLRNEVGEIWISGDSVTKGYWNNPEKDKAFQSIRGVTCFNTGDLGIAMDNELYILGRNVDAFIYHGKNYYYSDIEYIIESTDKNLVQSGALVLLTTDDTIVLLCELRKKKVDFSLKTLVQKIKRLLFIYFELTIEEMLLLLPYSIPKTSSRKKQRDASRKMYEDNLYKAIYTWKRTAGAALHETGQTQKEDRILAALSRMISKIKKQEIAVFYEDCFLDYITDSIDILKIVHQINIEFDIHLEV